jgi:dienelactone hydrolase
MKGITGLALAAALCVGLPCAAQAQDRVAILMPGAGGIHPVDFLIRNKSQIEAAGIRTIVTTSPAEAASASQSESAKGNKVVLVAMSLGVTHAASALASGAKVNGAVFVSGVYEQAKSNLGSASRLPATLMIHHAADRCPITSPDIARSFAQWSGGKASIRWINNSGTADGRPCGPRGAHGFFMKDGAAVSAIIGYVRSR